MLAASLIVLRIYVKSPYSSKMEKPVKPVSNPLWLFTDIKYYIAQNFQSCDSFCQSVGKVCAAEDHGFDTPQNVTSIFLQLGILCKLSSSSDYKLLTHPRIKTTGKPPGLCSGINKVPRRIDCHSAPTAVYAHRLCPCYGK